MTLIACLLIFAAFLGAAFVACVVLEIQYQLSQRKGRRRG